MSDTTRKDKHPTLNLAHIGYRSLNKDCCALEQQSLESEPPEQNVLPMISLVHVNLCTTIALGKTHGLSGDNKQQLILEQHMTENTAIETKLISFINEATNNYWLKNATPYLFSSLGYEIKKNFESDDLERVLQRDKLISWIKDKQDSAGVKIIRHPIQKEKLGLIPSEQNFSFDPEEGKTEHQVKSRKNKNNREIVTDFLLALSRLPEHEIEKVTIPVSVLAKLVSGEK